MEARVAPKGTDELLSDHLRRVADVAEVVQLLHLPDHLNYVGPDWLENEGWSSVIFYE